MTAILFVLLLALLPYPAPADDGVRLRAEFWTHLDPAPSFADMERDELRAARETLDRETAMALLDYAGAVFSGMVEGYEFEWTPSDRTRAIEERFALSPLGHVARGDPRLAVGQTRREGERFFVWLDFSPGAAGELMLESRKSEPWKSAAGRGGAPLGADAAGKAAGMRAAAEDAIREALRSLLRSLEPNKPRLVRGRVAFAAPPMLAVVSGRYLASVKIRAEVIETLGYGVY